MCTYEPALIVGVIEYETAAPEVPLKFRVFTFGSDLRAAALMSASVFTR